MRQWALLFGFTLFVASAQAQSKKEEAVKQVLKAYKEKLEKRDTTGITALFLPGARVYEGGSDEGSIQQYLNHHLGPELKAFTSFTFSDYQAAATVAGDRAYTTETYSYVIVLEKDSTQIKSKGVATSVLRKSNGVWKIEMTHSSFRRAR